GSFGFLLCLDQRLSRHERVPDEHHTARGGGKRISRLHGYGQSAAKQLTAGPTVFRPRCLVCEEYAYHCIELAQPLPLDQLEAQSTEAEADFEVSEESAGDETEVLVRETGAIAIAIAEAEVDGCADDQGQEVLVRAHCTRDGLREHIHGCACRGVG